MPTVGAPGRALLAATLASLLWACTVAVGTLLEYPPVAALQLTDLGREFGVLLLVFLAPLVWPPSF